MELIGIRATGGVISLKHPFELIFVTMVYKEPRHGALCHHNVNIWDFILVAMAMAVGKHLLLSFDKVSRRYRSPFCFYKVKDFRIIRFILEELYG